MTIHWTNLIVTDSEGDEWGELGGIVADAPANLDDAVIEDGKLSEWPQKFISAPGEEPEWDTPRGDVDWTGFEAALTAASACGSRRREMMKPTIRLTNDFHGTEAVVRPQLITAGRFVGYHRVSRKVAQRLVRDLCTPGCQCSGTFGERGGVRLTSAIINEDYERNYILDLRNIEQEVG